MEGKRPFFLSSATRALDSLIPYVSPFNPNFHDQ
jgi:hypothetical protein